MHIEPHGQVVAQIEFRGFVGRTVKDGKPGRGTLPLVERLGLRVCTRRPATGVAAAVQETNAVEAQVLLPERCLQARGFRAEKRTQIAFFTAHCQTQLAVAHHGVHLDAAESLRAQSDMNFRLTDTLHDAGHLYLTNTSGRRCRGICRGRGWRFRGCRWSPAFGVWGCGRRRLRQNAGCSRGAAWLWCSASLRTYSRRN